MYKENVLRVLVSERQQRSRVRLEVKFSAARNYISHQPRLVLAEATNEKRFSIKQTHFMMGSMKLCVCVCVRVLTHISLLLFIKD